MRHRRLRLVALLCACWTTLWVTGCPGDKPWNPYGDVVVPPPVIGATGIRGIVAALVTGSTGQAATYGLVLGASVYLESEPANRVYSGASGVFLLAPVNPGLHTVIGAFASQTATGIDWYKAMSQPVLVVAGTVASLPDVPLQLKLARANASGTVVDLVTQRPVTGVTVTTWGETTTTGIDGFFYVTNLPAGATLTAQLTCSGYQPRSVTAAIVATLTDLGRVGLTPLNIASMTNSLTPQISWASGSFDRLIVYEGDQVYALGNNLPARTPSVWEIRAGTHRVSGPVTLGTIPSGTVQIVPATATPALVRGEPYTVFLSYAVATLTTATTASGTVSTASGTATTTPSLVWTHFERGFVAGSGDVTCVASGVASGTALATITAWP